MKNFRKKYFLRQEQSLIPPFVNGTSKNWLFRGATITDHKTIALTELATCSRRSVWNKIPNLFNSWKVELKYTVFNPSKNQEVADGLALWYLPPSVQHTYESSQFSYGGPSGNFTGLLIAIDPYTPPKNNITLQRDNSESAIIVVYNDFPRMYNWTTEGHDIMSGQCLVTNRYNGSVDTISTLEVLFNGNDLSIYHSFGYQSKKFCLEVKNLKLPLGYNFGVSAATGGFKALFEIYHFKFYSDSQQIIQTYEEAKNINEEKTTKIDVTHLYFLNYGLIGAIIFIVVVFTIIIVVLLNSRKRKPKLDRRQSIQNLNLQETVNGRYNNERSVPQLPATSRNPIEPLNDDNYYEDICCVENSNYYDKLKFPKHKS